MYNMYNIKTSVIMKSFLNYSKLAIAMLITSSVFVACSDEITDTQRIQAISKVQDKLWI